MDNVKKVGFICTDLHGFISDESDADSRFRRTHRPQRLWASPSSRKQPEIFLEGGHIDASVSGPAHLPGNSQRSSLKEDTETPASLG
jgi:hypothetical protein